MDEPTMSRTGIRLQVPPNASGCLDVNASDSEVLFGFNISRSASKWLSPQQPLLRMSYTLSSCGRGVFFEVWKRRRRRSPGAVHRVEQLLAVTIEEVVKLISNQQQPMYEEYGITLSGIFSEWVCWEDWMFLPYSIWAISHGLSSGLRDLQIALLLCGVDHLVKGSRQAPPVYSLFLFWQPGRTKLPRES